MFRVALGRWGHVDEPGSTIRLFHRVDDLGPDAIGAACRGPDRERGHVSEDDLKAVKAAGWSEAQLVEIVQHVALNFWTNIFNETFKPDIDFPVVTARQTV